MMMCRALGDLIVLRVTESTQVNSFLKTKSRQTSQYYWTPWVDGQYWGHRVKSWGSCKDQIIFYSLSQEPLWQRVFNLHRMFPVIFSKSRSKRKVKLKSISATVGVSRQHPCCAKPLAITQKALKIIWMKIMPLFCIEKKPQHWSLLRNSLV